MTKKKEKTKKKKQPMAHFMQRKKRYDNPFLHFSRQVAQPPKRMTRKQEEHPLAQLFQQQGKRQGKKKQPAKKDPPHPMEKFMKGAGKNPLLNSPFRQPANKRPRSVNRKPLIDLFGSSQQPRRRGNPRTEKQRQARHKSRFGTINVPPRGTGLQIHQRTPTYRTTGLGGNRRINVMGNMVGVNDDQRKAMFARMMEEGTYDPRKFHKKGTKYTKEERKWLNWIARGRRGPSPYEKAKPYGVPPKTVEMEIKEHVANLKEKKKFLMGLDHYLKNNPERASAIRQNVDDWFRAQGKQPPPVDSYEFLFVAQSMKKLLKKDERLWYDETPGEKGIGNILVRRVDELVSRGELSKSDAKKFKKIAKGERQAGSSDLTVEKIMRITEKIDNFGKHMLTKQVEKDKSYEKGREAQTILEKAREIKAKRDVQEYGGTLMQLQLSDDSWHVIKAEDLEEFVKKKNIKKGTVKQVIFGEPGPDKSTLVYQKGKGRVPKSEMQKLRERAGLTEMQQEIKAEKTLEPKIKTLLVSQAKKQREEAKKARRERIRNMRLMEKQIRREEMEERKQKRKIERERQKEKDKDPFGIKKQALSQQPSESPAARAKRLAREAKAKKESKKAKKEYRFVGDDGEDITTYIASFFKNST